VEKYIFWCFLLKKKFPVDYVNDYFDSQKNANEEKNIIIQPSSADHANIPDECLIRELDYCYFVLGISDRFRDQFIMFRGTNQKTLNSFLYETIEQWSDENNYFMKRPPSLSVHLDYVYGFQVNLLHHLKLIFVYLVL